MKSFTQLAAVAALAAFATAQSSTASSAAAAPTEVTDCHLHGDTPFCFAGEDEWEIETDVNNDDLPDAYTDCHSHGADELCVRLVPILSTASQHPLTIACCTVGTATPPPK